MVSVVIPAFNEEQSIGMCLAALTRQDFDGEFEVIVVDNASTDRTVDIARSYADKLNLRVVREERKGRGVARAKGFSEARGGVILSTDADCEPPQTWVRELTEYLHQNHNAVAVTTPLHIRDVSPFRNAVLNLQPLLMLLYRLLWGHYWMNGFSFAIRREAYEASGGFNPECDAQEDTELGSRVRRIGLIHLRRKPRMPTSGRRFRNWGLLRGLWMYFSSFVSVRVTKGKRRANLSDER